MSDTAAVKTPITEKKETDARIAAMQMEIDKLKTNPHNFATTAICNVCGDVVTEKCPRHPNDVTNHFRTATDAEHAERKAPLVLVKQT